MYSPPKYKRLSHGQFSRIEKACFDKLAAQSKTKRETECAVCLSRQDCAKESARALHLSYFNYYKVKENVGPKN